MWLLACPEVVLMGTRLQCIRSAWHDVGQAGGRAQVLTVRDIMKYGVGDHMGARVELEELATKALIYSVAEGYTLDDLNEQAIPPLRSPCALHVGYTSEELGCSSPLTWG